MGKKHAAGVGTVSRTSVGGSLTNYRCRDLDGRWSGSWLWARWRITFNAAVCGSSVWQGSRVADRSMRHNSETEGMSGRKKRTVRDRLACQPVERRAKPLGGGGRAWSRGETWTREACDVAQT
jgi:hypothetical protein